MEVELPVHVWMWSVLCKHEQCCSYRKPTEFVLGDDICGDLGDRLDGKALYALFLGASSLGGLHVNDISVTTKATCSF